MLQLYSGDLLPKDSWDILSHENKSYLIDVRTTGEWRYLERPDFGNHTCGWRANGLPWSRN